MDSRGSLKDLSSQSHYITLAPMLPFSISIFVPAENLFIHVAFDSKTGNLSQSFGLKIVNTMMLSHAPEYY